MLVPDDDVEEHGRDFAEDPDDGEACGGDELAQIEARVRNAHAHHARQQKCAPLKPRSPPPGGLIHAVGVKAPMLCKWCLIVVPLEGGELVELAEREPEQQGRRDRQYVVVVPVDGVT